ncbi:MAG: alpha/beta hydrolase [Caulobacteraceae bacterium]|nr:alpha/beta hydrolase [Caulobacteraceae bacterium]
MSDLHDDDLETEALRLADEARRPKRRVRPRLARALSRGEDVEVDTPHGPVMAWRLGVGPATLLIHGWEDDNALWSPLIDACEQLGRAVVAFDLPGHGWSPSEAHSVEAAGEAALAVARALGPIDSVVGHSFGCGVTVYALAHGLEVSRAVLIASPVPRTKPYERFTEKWIQEQIDDGEDPEVVARAAEILRERLNDPAEPGYSAEADMPRMTAKALILHSIDDEACPVGNSEAMAGLWPDSDLVLTDELGHRLIAQDAAVVRRVIDFVEGF